MPDLITLNELKLARGVPLTDTSQDAEFEALINYSSAVILGYTDRDFGSAQVTETRTYTYDDSGFLDIDDATEVTAVEVVTPYASNLPLTTEEWRAMPQRRDDSPTYWYLLLPVISAPGISPEMGFKRNLDRIYYERGFRSLPAQIAVTATWGWPVVPEPVKLATLWTIEDWLATEGGGEDLTSESIGSFSRSWAARGAEGRSALSVPSRALSILAIYDKVIV